MRRCEHYHSPHEEAEYTRVAIENLDGGSQVLQYAANVSIDRFCHSKCPNNVDKLFDSKRGRSVDRCDENRYESCKSSNDWMLDSCPGNWRRWPSLNQAYLMPISYVRDPLVTKNRRIGHHAIFWFLPATVTACDPKSKQKFCLSGVTQGQVGRYKPRKNSITAWQDDTKILCTYTSSSSSYLQNRREGFTVSPHIHNDWG